ncbi:MAG: TadE/TadG family type IV pilus assembly protein [Actinomycetota bacterium]
MADSGTGQRGQATVELALALPLIALITGVLVEFGMLVADQARLWHAAREAARVAAVDPDEDHQLEAARATGLDDLEMRTRPEPKFRVQGRPVEVSLRYLPDGSVPLVGELFELITLSSSATMRIETP